MEEKKKLASGIAWAVPLTANIAASRMS